MRKEEKKENTVVTTTKKEKKKDKVLTNGGRCGIIQIHTQQILSTAGKNGCTKYNKFFLSRPRYVLFQLAHLHP